MLKATVDDDFIKRVAAIVDTPKHRRRRRDPKTGELLPLDTPKEQAPVQLTERVVHRRRRRDPKTGELLPLPPPDTRKALVGVREVPSPVTKPVGLPPDECGAAGKMGEDGIDALVFKHPLYPAAKWLADHMHATEQNYYRKEARRREIPLTYAIISDILGFFIVQNADICKTIQRNHSIITTSHGIRNKDQELS